MKEESDIMKKLRKKKEYIQTTEWNGKCKRKWM